MMLKLRLVDGADHHHDLRSDITFCSEAVICSCNWTGVKPMAFISPIKGSVIIPSGRTPTFLESSPSFQTFDLQHTSPNADNVGVGANIGYACDAWRTAPHRPASVVVLADVFSRRSAPAGAVRNDRLAAVVDRCAAAPYCPAHRLASVHSPSIKIAVTMKIRFPKVCAPNTSLTSVVYSTPSSSCFAAVLERRCGIPTSFSLYSRAR